MNSSVQVKGRRRRLSGEVVGDFQEEGRLGGTAELQTAAQKILEERLTCGEGGGEEKGRGNQVGG